MHGHVGVGVRLRATCWISTWCSLHRVVSLGRGSSWFCSLVRVEAKLWDWQNGWEHRKYSQNSTMELRDSQPWTRIEKRMRVNEEHADEILLVRAGGQRQVVSDRQPEILNVPSQINRSDRLTKHLDGRRLALLRDLLGIHFERGRAPSAPRTSSDSKEPCEF